MKLFDSHFHYYNKNSAGDYVSPESYFNKIKSDSLAFLMACGADYESSVMAREFAEAVKSSYFAAGVHPHDSSSYVKSIAAFDEFKGHEKLKAVGEIGVDYFYENSDRKAQRQVMEKFLELALSWQLPAIIHCRDKDNKFDAYSDAFSMLEDFHRSGGAFVVHCFAGNEFWCEKFLELDSFIGITGIVTFPKAQNIRDLLPVIPDDRLLIETDSPYLAPVPYRGKENLPCYVLEVAKKIADEKNLSVEEVAERTTNNALRFFNIK